MNPALAVSITLLSVSVAGMVSFLLVLFLK